MKFSNIVRNSQNGVKRRKYHNTVKFVRSNFVSNEANRVKGHRAKRLFNYNRKVVNREFDIKHSIGKDNSDESLISAALNAKNTLDQKFNNISECTNNQITPSTDEDTYRQLMKVHDKKLADARTEYTKTLEQASERQKKRIAFLKDARNKICYVCGAKGHVSKDCKSDKKKQQRQKRTLQYKKHLVEKKVYKMDLDVVYKNMLNKIQELESELRKYREQAVENASLPRLSTTTKEADGGKVTGETSHDVKMEEVVPKCCSTVEPPKQMEPKTIYEMSYDELKEHFARQEASTSSQSARDRLFIPGQEIASDESWSIPIVALLIIAILSLLLIVEIGITAKDYLSVWTPIAIDLFARIASSAKQTIYGWKSQIVCPNYSTLIVIVVVAGILRKFCSMVYRKVDGAIRWKAMSNYRDQLKMSGCTFRLPYNEKQLGTQEYHYTSKAEYQAVYNTTVANLSLVQILVFIFQASTAIICKIPGYLTIIYYTTRHIVKAIAKSAKFVISRLLVCISLILGLVKVCYKHKFISIFTAILLATYMSGMEISSVSVPMVLKRVCQFENQARAMFASLFGSMTFRTRGFVQLTTAIPTFSRTLTFLKGLVTRILGMLK